MQHHPLSNATWVKPSFSTVSARTWELGILNKYIFTNDHMDLHLISAIVFILPFRSFHEPWLRWKNRWYCCSHPCSNHYHCHHLFLLLQEEERRGWICHGVRYLCNWPARGKPGLLSWVHSREGARIDGTGPSPTIKLASGIIYSLEKWNAVVYMPGH